MKKRFFLFLSFLPFLVNGQATFQKTYLHGGNDSYHRILMLADSSFILCGVTSDTVGSMPYYPFLQKLHKDGSHDWMRTYPHPAPNGPTAFEVTSIGEYLMALRGVLIKFSSNGDTIWTRSYSDGGSNSFYDIKKTADHGYVLAGSDNVANSQEYLVMKFDSLDNMQWAHTAGSVFDEFAKEVMETSDGGYLVGGNSVAGGGTATINIIKLNAGGDTVWAKSYSGSGAEGMSSMVEVADGFIVAGQTTSVDSATLLIFKINFNGNLQWTRSYGCANTLSYATEIIYFDNHLFLTGKLEYPSVGSDDIVLMKTDLSGDTIWTKTYGSSATIESANSFAHVPGSGFLIAGNNLGFQPLNPNLYLIKTDYQGNSGCYETVVPLIMKQPVLTETTFPVFFFTATTGMESFPIALSSHVPDEQILCITKVEDISSPGFSIYPNPTSDNIYIETELQEDYLAEIHGMDGRNVIRKQCKEGCKINVSGLASGIYILNLTGKDRRPVTVKVVKQND